MTQPVAQADPLHLGGLGRALPRAGSAVTCERSADAQPPSDLAGSKGINPLLRVLRRLSQPKQEEPARLRDLVLQEIDETVLPRSVTIFRQDVPLIDLAMVHRRLLGLTVRIGGAAPLPERATTGVAVAVRFAARLQQVERMLSAAGQERDALHLLRRPDRTLMDPESCTAAQLQAALETSAEPVDPCELLLAEMLPHAIAWKKTPEARGAGTDLSCEAEGLPEGCAVLEALERQVFAQSQTPMIPGKTQPSCTVLPLSQNAVALVAASGAARLLMLLPPQVCDRARRLWLDCVTEV